LAIQGGAFFAVNKGGRTYYTRVGSFSFDSTGRLVNSGTGAVLQGKLADTNGVLPSGTRLEDLKIALDQKSPAKATSTIKFSGNLDAQASVATSALSGNIDPTAAIGTVASKTFTVTDDFGIAHDITVALTKTAADNYSVAISGTNGAVTGGTGTAVFNPTTGAVTSFTPATITFTPSGGAPAMAMNITTTGLTQAAGATSFVASLDHAADSTDAAVSVFDSLGNRHALTLKMTKTANTNEWSWSADIASPATIASGRTGKMLFNDDGTLKAFSFDDGSTMLTVNPNNGANPMSVNLNVGTAGVYAGITQSQGTSSVTPREQDGYAAGTMSNISIDQSGKIQGTFSNGTVLTLGQVLLAEFNNPSGLVKTGDNMYDISGNSGVAANVVAGESSSSTIVSGSLEQSNVDLSEEFTRMITAQRGFQANARVITTSDTFLQEVVDLKR
jgi:flagellar hook protein FlgE